jgi:hypothetical protein
MMVYIRELSCNRYRTSVSQEREGVNQAAGGLAEGYRRFASSRTTHSKQAPIVSFLGECTSFRHVFPLETC